MYRWWDGADDERYWLEITDRPDLGVDLNAPQAGDNGRPQWSYELVTLVRDGDIVLHYHKPHHAVVGYSRAVGQHWESEVIWGSHGTVARNAGVQPYPRPGWRLAVEDYTPLRVPLTLERIHQAEPELWRLARELKGLYRGPIYFPFALSNNRPPRPAQAYLTKFPLALLRVFPELSDAAAGEPLAGPGRTSTSRGIGADYRPAAEDAATASGVPFVVDPAIRERGLKGHATTQNAVAEWARRRGLVPRSPAPGEPNFDVAWLDSGTVFVVEVKSTTTDNEETQLRLGLGQVLRYRQLLAEGDHEVQPVLAVEREPGDKGWFTLCKSLNVWLVWPDALDGADPV